MRRIPRRRDANEGDIIDAFTALGWSVQRISAKGAPDLVCAKGSAGGLRGSEDGEGEADRGPGDVARQLARTQAGHRKAG
jgi:hypothetical protein